MNTDPKPVQAGIGAAPVPAAVLHAGLSHLDAAAGGFARAAREAFGRLLACSRSAPPVEVAQHYVATFQQVTPAVIGPGGTLMPGADGLGYLADLAWLASPAGRAAADLPGGGMPVPREDRQPPLAVRAS